MLGNPKKKKNILNKKKHIIKKAALCLKGKKRDQLYVIAILSKTIVLINLT